MQRVVLMLEKLVFMLGYLSSHLYSPKTNS